MRILLDECVNPRLKRALVAHDVKTVAEADWLAIADSELLARADGVFDVLITLDQGFAHQQNLTRLSIAIVILHVKKNTMLYYEPLLTAIEQPLSSVRAGTVTHVP